ncbi:hypothetical protein DESAMIL20_1980 [Desulfurella amilsii]|uniref:Uncharacterized protein n=1 Tax=Desulfurella amilsii TaxID=1562698 RepID=A0A1X4XY17_9BACT|nr:hypothetical protein [Desulfurella amilsii]OSS42427.1 hypothetical protein DESAMIL20_1980 [Desulfurella amilsii]
MFLNLGNFTVWRIKRVFAKLSPLLVFIYLMFPLHAFAGGVNVNLNIITTPYYPPPAMVYVPDVQAYIAETAPFPVFYVGNVYYSFYNNMWYFGPTYNGPWRFTRVIPMQLRRFHPNNWGMLQRQAHEYYRNPHWNHFIASPDKRYYKYEHSKEYNRFQNNHEHFPGNSQYNRGGYNNNNQYHPQYDQHNGYGR